MSSDAQSRSRSSARGEIAAALATVGGNLFLVLGTLVCGLVALAVSWVPPRGNLVYRIARLWSRGLLWSSGVSLAVERQVELDSGRPYIFMSNHQSLYDIPALIASLPGQARFLAKRSLFRIPVFGWAIRAGGFISIDREDRSRAGRSFSAAVARLRAGASAVVFPEGTRSLDGRLLEFQRGGFLLALKSGLPIVPVGIRGSLEVQPKGRRRVCPGRLSVRYGRPIATQGYGIRDRERLSSEVRERIEELARLRSDPSRETTSPSGEPPASPTLR